MDGTSSSGARGGAMCVAAPSYFHCQWSAWRSPCAWQPRPTFIASGARGGAPVRGSPVLLSLPVARVEEPCAWQPR
ncbi:MAG: hypothetical protein IKJ81_08645 [Bacteroidales bacterium]|nr:hypothetical protein [Bacteroidales bacterium]